MTIVWVPVCEIGVGTGTAAVRDSRSYRVVHVERAVLSLIGSRVYARASMIDRDGSLSLVAFEGLTGYVWVENAVADSGTPELAA